MKSLISLPIIVLRAMERRGLRAIVPIILAGSGFGAAVPLHAETSGAIDPGAQMARAVEDYRAIFKKLPPAILPRYSDPATAAVLDRLSDADGSILRNIKGSVEDLAICAMPARVAAVYINRNVADASPTAGPQNALQQAANRKAYEAETIPIVDFSHRCFTRVADATTDMVAKLPAAQKKVEVQRLQDTAADFFRAAALIAQQQSLTAPYMKRFLDTDVECAPTYAAILTLPQRKETAKFVRAKIAEAPEDTRAQLEALAKALDDRQCEKLCKE